MAFGRKGDVETSTAIGRQSAAVVDQYERKSITMANGLRNRISNIAGSEYRLNFIERRGINGIMREQRMVCSDATIEFASCFQFTVPGCDGKKACF